MSARTCILTATLVLAIAMPATAGEGVPATIVHANGACSSCEVMPVAYTRMKTSGGEHPLFAHRKQQPKCVELCPGGCFGYFPTQWRSWDEACGFGPILSMPVIPSSSDMIPGKNGRAPEPRSIDAGKGRSMVAPLQPLGTRIN
jgi:hypothetical protein